MSKVVNNKLQKMYNALQGANVVVGSFVYRTLVPKRFQHAYEEAKQREDNNEKLSAMDKTYLYGYLNPRYHTAVQIRKHIH